MKEGLKIEGDAGEAPVKGNRIEWLCKGREGHTLVKHFSRFHSKLHTKKAEPMHNPKTPFSTTFSVYPNSPEF